MVLKFIGIPLRQIAVLRRSGAGRLAEGLRAQHRILERKRQLLDQAILAIQELEFVITSGHGVEPTLFKRIIEAIEMHNDSEAWKKHYDELVSMKIARMQSLSPEAAVHLRAEWNALLAEIRAARTENPAGAKAQELGVRWEQLLSRLMGQPVPAGALAAHHTAQEWTPQMAPFVDKTVWDFMTLVLTARRG